MGFYCFEPKRILVLTTFFVVLSLIIGLNTAQYITTTLNPPPPYIISSEDVDPISVEVRVTFDFTTFTTDGVAAGKVHNITLNYAPQLAAFDPTYSIPCINVDDPADTLFEFGAQDGIAMRGVFNFPQSWKTTRTGTGSANYLNAPVYQIPPGTHTCILMITIEPQYAAYREYIGGAFANIPDPGTVYGYEIYDAIGRHVSSSPLDLPVPTYTFSTESRNSCYGDNTYCIFKLTISNFVFDAGTAGPQFKLDADFSKVPSYSCFGEDGTALLATIPDETDPTSTILVPTQALYQLHQNGIIGEVLEAICVFNTGSLPTVSGSIMAEYTPMMNYIAGTKSLFKQPVMGPTALIYPHIQACYVGQECKYTLEFAENILIQSPLLQLTFPIPSEFKLTANDMCILNQFDADTIYIQVIKRTMSTDGLPIRCTIIFTPTVAALKLTGIHTPEAILQLGYRRLLSLKAYNLDPIKVPDFDSYLQILQNTAAPLDLTMYTESTVFVDTLLPFSPISNEPYLTLTPTQVGSCDGVEFCEVTYSFKSYYGIKRIRFPNNLRFSDGTLNQECRDAMGVVGYLTIDPSLEYLYLTPVSEAGFTWGSCTLNFEMLVINNPGLIPYEYELSTYDALPHSNVSNIFSLTSGQTIYDYVMHPSMTPFRLLIANFFQQTNTRNNWLTFNVQHGNPRAPLASTKSIEVVFSSLSGGDFFQFSQASCFIPNVLNLQVGPSCTVTQNGPNVVLINFNRNSNNLNTPLAQISWDSDSDVPVVIDRINIVLEWTDSITGLPNKMVSKNAGNVALPSFSPGDALIWADLQNPSRPTKPADLLNQNILLFSGRTTSFVFDVPKGFIVGSKLIFQLYYTTPGRAAHNPLRVEFANNEELLSLHKLSPTSVDDSCEYCLAYIIGKNTNAVQNGYWFQQPLKEIALQLTYLDTYLSFATNTEVKLLVKVETSFDALNWINLGSPVKQHITSTWQMPLSPKFITYNYVIENKNIFLRNGLSVNSAIAGPDSEVLNSQVGDGRQIITLQLQSSGYSSELISNNLVSTSFRYSFTGCRVWRYADQAGCVSSYDSPTDVTSVTCGPDRTSVEGIFNTLFTFYAPEENTAQITCTFTASVIMVYTTGNRFENHFPTEVTFIPAVQQQKFMFARQALVCGTSDIPMAYLGGSGVYTLYSNSIEYSITPVQHTDYSVTMAADRITMVFTAHPSSQKTKGVATTTIPIYAVLNCPQGGYMGVHEVPWTFSYRSSQSSEYSNGATIYARNGFYIYSPPSKSYSKMTFELARNSQNELIADPQNGLSADLTIYFHSSLSSQYTFQLAPPNRQLLFGILSSNRWQTYTYTTHGYDTTGAPAVITKTTIANMWYASDVTRLQLQFSSDIHLFDFNRWESYGSEFEYPIAGDTVYNKKYGVHFPAIPFSRYDGTLILSQCLLSACNQIAETPLSIYLPLQTIFTFQPELWSVFASTLTVNREFSVGDSLTLIIDTDGIALQPISQNNVAGYSVTIVSDVTAGFIIKVICATHFPPSYVFSIPTSANPTTSDPARIASGGSVTFDVELNYKSGDDIFTVTQVAQKATFKPLFSPISNLSFPRGVRAGSDNVIRFTLGRPFGFSQRIKLSPLPVIPGRSYLTYSGGYQLSIISAANNATDPRDVSITIANRYEHDIPAGTTLEFTVPFSTISDTFEYTEVLDTDPKYALTFTSNGFGPLKRPIVGYNVLRYGLAENLNSFSIWAQMHATIRMVQAGTNYLPCRAGELCAMTFRLDKADGTGYPLSNLNHFDIVVDFADIVDDEFRLIVSPVPPPEYQNKVVLTEFGYQFQVVYLSDQLVIRVDVDPNAIGPVTLHNIPIYAQFEEAQPEGVVSIRIIKRNAVATIPLDLNLHFDDQVSSEPNSHTIYHDDVAPGPSVVSSSSFQPYFFYVNGGLFINEPYSFGLAPSIPLSSSPTLSADRPQATTLTAEFTFDPPIDIDMTYEQTLGFVFNATRQLVAASDDWASTVLLEIHSTGLSIVLYQDGVASGTEAYVLSPRPEQLTVAAIEIDSGFTFKAYAQKYDLSHILPDSPIPYTTAQLSPENKIIDTQPVVKGFSTRIPPWIRVYTTILTDGTPMDVLPMDYPGTTTLSIFININLPTFKDDPTNTHKISAHDLLTLHIPPFYSVEVTEYICQSTCSSGLCNSMLVYNGDFFFFRFHQEMATQYICSIPMSVKSNVFYAILENEGSKTPFAELTKSSFRYYAASAIEPLVLDESFNPVESQTPSDLPTKTSSSTWENDDIQTIEDKYLTFFLQCQCNFHHLTSNIVIFNIVTSIGDAACVDQSSGITVARVSTSCATLDNPRCIQLTLVDSQTVPKHFQCSVQITPQSEYPHYRKSETTKVKIYEIVPTTGRLYHYTAIATARFTAVNFISTDFLTLRKPTPTMALSGSLIEGMNLPLTITGSQILVNPGDFFSVSIGSRFRPVGADWTKVICLDPSGNPAAAISFFFNTQPFIYKNGVYNRDGNVDNVDQIATSFNLSYLGKSSIYPHEKFTCSFVIMQVDVQTSRSPAIFQFTKSVSTGLMTTVKLKSPASFRTDRQTDVNFGFNMNNRLSQSQASVLLYFNSTVISQTISSSPVLYIYLPIVLTGLPETYSAQCALSTVNVEPTTLPFQQLQITSTSSVYIIPLDRYIQYATDELSWVSCTLPNIQAGTQRATELGRLEMGTSTLFTSTFFEFPSVINHNIIQNYKTITPLEHTEEDLILENLVNNTLVFNNLEPTTLDFLIVNSGLGEIASPISNSRVAFTMNTDCMSTSNDPEIIAKVQNNALVTTSTRQSSNLCTATITPAVIRVADISASGVITTPIYPPGCGTWVNPVYCTLNTKITVYMENGELPKYLQYAANITFTPKATPIPNFDPTNFYSAASWAVDFSGYYPDSTVQLILNPAVVVSGVKLRLLINDTVVDECPTIDGLTYTCVLDAVKTPYWKIVRAIVLYQVDGIAPSTDIEVVSIFTLKINQASVLPTSLSDSVVLSYDRRVDSFATLKFALTEWLIGTGQSEPFSKFIQDSSTTPTITITYPSSSTASTTGTPLPRGKMLDFGFIASLLPIHTQTIVFPIASVIENTVPTGSMKVKSAITTLFVSPYGANFVDEGSDKDITVKTKCVDTAYDKDISLFDITLYLNRTGVVPQVIAQFDMVSSNIAKYFNFVHSSDNTISCDFPLSFIGHDQAVDLAPPIPLDENIEPIIANLDHLYAVSYTPSQTISTSVYDPYGSAQISNGMVIFHRFDTTFYNQPAVSIELESEVLSIGSLGSMRVSIDTINVANGDILLIKFSPQIPESLVDDKKHATTTLEATFTGEGSYSDFLINDGAQYNAIRKQQYQFAAPTMDNNAGLCYNTFYDNSTSPQPLATLTALNSQFNSILGGSSDIFMLNLTQPPKYGSSSFLFTQFQCDVTLFAQHQHPFDGIITAKYVTRASFEAIQRSSINSQERVALSTALLPSNTTHVVGKIQNPITRGFDIRLSATPTINTHEILNATISLSSSPPQHNIFLTVNFTRIQPQSFFGCEGATVKFADWYGRVGGVTNELFDNLLRIFVTSVGEDTTTITCSFLSSDITPIEYREFASLTNPVPKYATDPDSRPAYNIHVTAYKLISRANILTSTWLNRQQKALLAPLYQPETFEEFLNIPFFTLAPIAEYDTSLQTTFEEPTYADSLVFYIADRNPVSPYFTLNESNRFLDAIYSHITIHMGSGLYLRYDKNSLVVSSESFTISTRILTVVVGYITNNPISTSHGVIGPNSINIIAWQSLFQIASGQRIVHENSIAALTERWPTIGYPSLSSHSPAVSLNSIMTLSPVYSRCLVGQTGGNCRKSSIGLSCSRNSDCLSESCSISFQSKVDSSPQATQYGVTIVIGTCMEKIELSSLNVTARHSFEAQTALMKLYYQSDYYKSRAGFSLSQNIEQKQNVMRYYATSNNEREYAQQMYYSVLNDPTTQVLFTFLTTSAHHNASESIDSDLTIVDPKITVEGPNFVQFANEHSSSSAPFSPWSLIILAVLSLVFLF